MSFKWLLDTTFHPTFGKKITKWTPCVYFEIKILNHILDIERKTLRKKSTMQPFYILMTFRKKIIKWLPNAFTTRNHQKVKLD
jgi:hypothetical protein